MANGNDRIEMEITTSEEETELSLMCSDQDS